MVQPESGADLYILCSCIKSNPEFRIMLISINFMKDDISGTLSHHTSLVGGLNHASTLCVFSVHFFLQSKDMQ